MPSSRRGSAALALGAAVALALPMPVAAQEALVVSLCDGGTIALPIRQKEEKHDGRKDCRVACHSGDSRKRPARLPV
ncbi:MAG TPA: hypothetical protein VJM81_03250 [Rhizorhapis sp.]|nr:hypothetical protein [Rhizorhapis sp.]